MGALAAVHAQHRIDRLTPLPRCLGVGVVGRNAGERQRSCGSPRALAQAPPVTTTSNRFRGFLPVVVDVETGGLNPATDALLEVAAVLLGMNDEGELVIRDSHRCIVKPFEGARLDPASLKVTGIDPYSAMRPALDEGKALRRLFKPIRSEVKAQSRQRAILVGHNAFFDLQFVNAAVERARVKRNPFHPFSSFDTATLAGVAFGQTVLSRAVAAAGLAWEDDRAHSALYDSQMTANLLCEVVNRFRGVYEARAPASPQVPTRRRAHKVEHQVAYGVMGAVLSYGRNLRVHALIWLAGSRNQPAGSRTSAYWARFVTEDILRGIMRHGTPCLKALDPVGPGPAGQLHAFCDMDRRA